MQNDTSLPTLKANFIHFLDANTLCYSNLDFYDCKGDMIELKYRFDIIESTLWICEKCFNDIDYSMNKNTGLII
jgi:hypothetical protein